MANRRCRGVIPSIKTDSYPTHILVLDTEAYRDIQPDGVEVQSLMLGVMRYVEIDDNTMCLMRDEYHTVYTVGEIIGVIEYYARKDKTLYLYAHNLGYDLQLTGLLPAMIADGWTITGFVIEDIPTYITLRKKRYRLVMVDTMNYWQTSVAAMGRQLGLPKMEIPPQNAPVGMWVDYCKRDVDVLTEYLLSFMRFLRSERLGGMGLTLASQAFRTYRYRFMSTPIEVHNNPDVLRLERDGYCGGRVEAFYIGELPAGEYYKLDVNSMYPYVMKSYRYPIKLVAYGKEISPERLKELLHDYYVIARCELNTSTPIYTYKLNPKLTFPVGRFVTVLHTPEIQIALERGDITRVIEVAIYDMGDIFSDYVDYFYTLKLQGEQEGNLILRTQAKLLLNSLYGKFGQRGVVSRFVDWDGDMRYERLTGYSEALCRWVEVNYLGDKIEIRYPEGESYYSCPAIAGAVTAYGRVALWRYMMIAGLANVYYVDTDSLIVNLEGYDRLSDYIHPTKLGCLKLEETSERLSIYGLKHYQMGGKLKIKGVPKTATPLSKDTWSYAQFRGLKTWLRDGMPDGMLVTPVTKHLSGIYDKGIINPDGTVSPLTLDVRGDGD